MKKQVHPAFIVVAMVIVLAGAATLLYHAANDKPTYPGLNAPHPAAEVAGGAKKDTGRDTMPTGQSVTYEQAQKMHIPGMAPGAKPPPGMKIPGQ
jgi:Spy/CpxP family protein refolding chaperone